VCTFFSGIVDEHDAIRGKGDGYPGAFRDLLGVRVEEFFPLAEGEAVRLSNGASATVWTEALHPRGAAVEATYLDGPLPGWPAVTAREHGDGVARYVTTRLDDASLSKLLAGWCAEAGVRPPIITAAGIEAVRRLDGDRSYLFVINHTERAAEVPAVGEELLTGAAVTGALRVPAGGVAVVREATNPEK
jgi:beta-galactosidase